MRRTKNVLMMVAGIAIGMVISVPAVNAASEYLTAVPSAQTFYMDGRQIYLEAYSINGNNYVKLRDIGQAVDFNVSYDAQTNSVRIAPNEPYSEDAPAVPAVTPAVTPTTPPTATQSSYTINTDHWSREDFSQQANPAVFTGYYDRELYNTIRQTMLDGTSQDPALAKGEDYSAAVNVLGRMSGVKRYEHHVPDNFRNYYEYLDYFAVSAETPENYQEPLEFIQPVIQATAGMTDREKVEYLNDYLRTLLTYDRKATAMPNQTFAEHSKELKGACGSYAVDFKFLCNAADIPCITISTKDHTWNLVYTDGEWLHVDVAYNDYNNTDSMLLAESYPNHDDIAPEATEFLKELLVPGSTK